MLKTFLRHSNTVTICIKPTCRNDLDRRIDSSQHATDSRTAHNWHHHIRQDDGDFLPVVCVNGDCVRSILCSQNTVAECLQCLTSDSNDGGLIIDDQNRFTV